MQERPIRGLIVADEPDNVQLLEEAFQEIEESRFTRTWMQPCARTYAVDAAEAVELLRQEEFDIAVLDGARLREYLAIREEAPELPVLVVAGADEEPQAISLVRQGAQDYLVRRELDCLPLARAMRCSIERQRWAAASKVEWSLCENKQVANCAGRDL